MLQCLMLNVCHNLAREFINFWSENEIWNVLYEESESKPSKKPRMAEEYHHKLLFIVHNVMRADSLARSRDQECDLVLLELTLG